MSALAEAARATTPAEEFFASLAGPRPSRHTLRVTRRPEPPRAPVASAKPATVTPVGPGTAENRAGQAAERRSTRDDHPVPGSSGARPRGRLLPVPVPARSLRVEGPALAVPPTVVERVRALRAGDRSFVVEAEDEDRGAPPTADPGLVVRRLATASVEVITGVRPAAQLARWLAPGVLDALRVRSTLGRHAALRASRAPACRAVRVSRLDPHVVEATAVVDDGRRVRAVALRLETHRGAWRATALEIG